MTFLGKIYEDDAIYCKNKEAIGSPCIPDGYNIGIYGKILLNNTDNKIYYNSTNPEVYLDEVHYTPKNTSLLFEHMLPEYSEHYFTGQIFAKSSGGAYGGVDYGASLASGALMLMVTIAASLIGAVVS
jgi:hypothetical protein